MLDRDEIFDVFQDTVNMTVGELEAWEDSPNREAYAERKSAGQNIDEPLDDAIDLLETPRDEWTKNDFEEARELNNFVARMSAVEQGDPMPGTDPELSKRDASLINWAHDPNPRRKDFKGDRQR